MNKLDILNNILDFLPELFSADLSAITLSNTTHFIGIWGKPDNTLGQSIKTLIYPGKPLIPEVMLGQVMLQGKKITKYYTDQESITGLPYLAVGVPIVENNEILGGICAVREETILETQKRCEDLLEVQDVLAGKMIEVSSKVSTLVNSYREVRTISDLIQYISQKANVIGINTSLESTQEDKNSSVSESIITDLQELADHSTSSAEQIVSLLNQFDSNTVKLFSSISQIETVVNNMSHTITEIMDYLTDQSNIIIKGK